jgi:glycosyltransferase involved in cell wall biosynthesis
VTEPDDHQGASSDDHQSVSVCLPTVRAGDVSAAIESVRRQTHENWELVIVMQGHDDDLRSLVDRAERAEPRIRGLWIPDRGASKARNAGAAAASHDLLAFIDDDCRASPDWLASLVDALGSDSSVGIVAGSLVAPPHHGRRPSKCPESIPDDFTFRPSSDHRELSAGARFVTANCAVARWAWALIGPFDEELGAGTSFRGGEDLDFLIRAVDAGVPIRFLPDSVVEHTSGRRFGIRPVTRLSTAYGAGQGAVAAKLSLAGKGGDAWRRAMWGETVGRPLRRLRVDRVAPRIPRILAFERAYRRCTRDYSVDDRGLLVRRAGGAGPPGGSEG